MKKMYFKHVALALGIVAVAGTANADWSDVSCLYLKNTSFIPGWCGSGISGFGAGAAEAWDTPFEIYQVIPDAPAGKYTLTANAFYRYGSIEEAQAGMTNGANHNTYLFLGTAQKPVEGLFDKDGRSLYPNTMDESAAEFAKGEFVNTVEFDHKGGDLKFGIANPVDKVNQWAIFDNFKLVGPNGEITVENGDFDQIFANDKGDDSVWEHTAFDGQPRTIQMNEGNGGAKGCFRLTNASARNLGQYVTLPAGTYRLGMQSFFRYGHGNNEGWWVACKSDAVETGVVTGYDNHKNGNEDIKNYPVIYVSEGVGAENLKPVDATEIADITAAGKLYKETPVKCLYDETLDKYPDNEPSTSPTPEGERVWNDSGFEQQAAALFISRPDLYRNYVEFTLDTEKSVWVGFKKDNSTPSFYWWAFRNVTLEKQVNGGSGVADLVVEDENAPVEYYNLQGIRVANPENGLYIVKQGNKVTKRIIK